MKSSLPCGGRGLNTNFGNSSGGCVLLAVVTRISVALQIQYRADGLLSSKSKSVHFGMRRLCAHRSTELIPNSGGKPSSWAHRLGRKAVIGCDISLTRSTNYRCSHGLLDAGARALGRQNMDGFTGCIIVLIFQLFLRTRLTYQGV